MKAKMMNSIGGGQICRAILATYYKIGTYNVIEHNFPAILEIYETLQEKEK